MPAPRMPAGWRRPSRVIVIGAGLAGLAAAYRLARAGVSVIVLERETEVGGRLRSDLACTPDPAPELYGLARELGVESALERRAVLWLAIATGGRTELRSFCEEPGWLPWRALAQARLQRLLAWFAGTLDPSDPDAGLRLDDRSVADFARVYLGRRRSPRLYAPALELGFGLAASDTSRLLLLRWLDACGDLRLATLARANVLPRALAKALPDVRLGEPACAVSADGRSVHVASGATLGADAVIVATAAADARPLFPKPGPRAETFFAASRGSPRLLLRGRAARPLPAPFLALRHRSPLAGAIAADEHVALVATASFAAQVTSPADARDELTREARFAHRALQSFEPTTLPRLEKDTAFPPGHFRRAARMREEQARSALACPVLYAGGDGFGPDPESAVSAGHHLADRLLG